MRLYRLEPKDGKRELVFGSATFLTGKSGDFIQLDISRFGEHSYKLVPTTQLKPGEYAFTTVDLQEVFCFGLDK
jgi:hypothetical protein